MEIILVRLVYLDEKCARYKINVYFFKLIFITVWNNSFKIQFN